MSARNFLTDENSLVFEPQFYDKVLTNVLHYTANTFVVKHLCLIRSPRNAMHEIFVYYTYNLLLSMIKFLSHLDELN